MKKLWCSLRGHRFERVASRGLMVIPSIGMVTLYVRDDEGNMDRCARCQLITDHEPC